VKKSKKDKKEKKVKGDVEMTDALEAELEKAPEDSLVKVVSAEDGEEPRGALVPFAFPLADDTKEVKKILKTVKKCMFLLPYHTLSAHILTSPSRQDQDPPPRRQGSRQSAAQIPSRIRRPRQPRRHRRHRRRHLAHGRHLAHPRALRRPQRALHLHQVARTARRGQRNQATHERRHGIERPDNEEQEGRQGRGCGGVC
jgi:hypothetical protein